MESDEAYKALKQVTYYKNNIPQGIAWKGLIGGAFLVGTLDSYTEEFSGRDVIYLYPDLINGIQGRFEGSRLVAGYHCRVERIEFDPETGLLKPCVAVNESERNQKCKIKQDVSTNITISQTPLAPDAWEAPKVEVRMSHVQAIDGVETGEGLFTKMHIKKNHIVALFNGVREMSVKDNAGRRPSEYRIRLNGETDIDIPDEYKDLKKYCATLGHKANHSFEPNGR